MEASAARRPSHSGPRIPARLLRLASDERLVDYVRAGSEPAFETVFDRHHRGILAFCRHMLGSAEEAEDAVQHTFMAAYRSLVGSRREIQLRPWLYTIARNRCLSVLRARRERPVDDVGELPTENLSAEVQRRQDLRDMLRDVGELPEEQRAALVLAEVGGVSHEEIADVLGVQREKVKALVFQARSSLIASRAAREAPCAEIRGQLADLRGGALRRNTLRRHLNVCPGCREFRAALQDQRKMLAVALPVVPTIALKQSVMGAALGSGAATAAGGAATVGGAAGAAAGGSMLAGGGAAMTAKVLAIAALTGGGAVGAGAVATGYLPILGGSTAEQGERRAPAAGAGPADAAPDAIGGSRQERSESGTGDAKRRDDERSHGRRGIEQRSDRADERAAGPKLTDEVLTDEKRTAATNPRALERGAPDLRRQDAAKRPEPKPRPQPPVVEKPLAPAPAQQPEAGKPEQPAVPEPAPQSAPAPVPTAVVPDQAADRPVEAGNGAAHRPE